MIIRKIGLWFLKWSGLDIPDNVAEDVLIPIVLEITTELKDDSPEYKAQVLKEQKEMLLRYASHYIKFETETEGDKEVITSRIIVQRPDQ